MQPYRLNKRANLVAFHSHVRNDENVLAPEFEYHPCFFVNHEVHDEREEEHEERQGTAGIDFFDTSDFFVFFQTFVVQPSFSTKLRGRNNQTRCGLIEIKNIHDDLTAHTEN